MEAAETTLNLLSERKTHVTYYYSKDANGEWRWHLKASNGKIRADSGEGYKNKAECIAAIEDVKRSRNAPVVEIKSK